MIFRTNFRKQYDCEPEKEFNSCSRALFTAVAVNSVNACGPERLFSSCQCRALPARAIYRVGGLRGSAHAISSDSSLAAYPFSDLGNCHGVAAVALSLDTSGELVGTKGGRRAVPGRFPPALSRQAGLPGNLCDRPDSGRRDRLQLQPGTLRRASLENPAAIGPSTQRTIPTFKAPLINLCSQLIFIGALLPR